MLGLVQGRQILLEFKALEVSGPVDEVVIHGCDEVKKFLLKHLDSVHQLPEHLLILKLKSLSRSHLVDFTLIVFGIRITSLILLQQIWLLEVEVTLLHQVLCIFDMNQQFENSVVLPMDSLLVNYDLDGPLAVVAYSDLLKVLQRALVEPRP